MENPTCSVDESPARRTVLITPRLSISTDTSSWHCTRLGQTPHSEATSAPVRSAMSWFLFLFFDLFVSPPPRSITLNHLFLSAELWHGGNQSAFLPEVVEQRLEPFIRLHSRERASRQLHRDRGRRARSSPVKQASSVSAKQSEVNQSSEREATHRLSTVESSALFPVKSTHSSEKSHFNLWHFQIYSTLCVFNPIKFQRLLYWLKIYG